MFLSEEVLHLIVMGSVYQRFVLPVDLLHHLSWFLKFLAVVVPEVVVLVMPQISAQRTVGLVLQLEPHVRGKLRVWVVQFVQQLRILLA